MKCKITQARKFDGKVPGRCVVILDGPIAVNYSLFAGSKGSFGRLAGGYKGKNGYSHGISLVGTDGKRDFLGTMALEKQIELKLIETLKNSAAADRAASDAVAANETDLINSADEIVIEEMQ